jgi:hypothetical protein
MSEKLPTLAQLRAELAEQDAWLAEARANVERDTQRLAQMQDSFLHMELGFNQALEAVPSPQMRLHLGDFYTKAVAAARISGEQIVRHEVALQQIERMERRSAQLGAVLAQLGGER